MKTEINLKEVHHLFYKKNDNWDFENLDDNKLKQSICDDLEQIVHELGFKWDGQDGVGDLVSELKADIFYTL